MLSSPLRKNTQKKSSGWSWLWILTLTMILILGFFFLSVVIIDIERTTGTQDSSAISAVSDVNVDGSANTNIVKATGSSSSSAVAGEGHIVSMRRDAHQSDGPHSIAKALNKPSNGNIAVMTRTNNNLRSTTSMRGGSTMESKNDEKNLMTRTTRQNSLPAIIVPQLSKSQQQELADKRGQELLHMWSHKNKDQRMMDLHFIHIPKCGGTSMTAILREVACNVDTIRNNDCCTNPGFCDWHAHRRCSSIKGCINHFPQTPWIYKAPPSITLMRNPQSRLISAWFYRGHSPNLDFFQVRPWFKDIKNGLRPKVQFDEYLDMIEYNNIQTRMLGADSFPYRNITIDQQIFNVAVKNLNNMYFVGLQEAYDLSVKLLLRELSFKKTLNIKKERDQTSSKAMQQRKQEILSNSTAIAKLRVNNRWDFKLYQLAKERFCQTLRKHSDLYALLPTTKVKCE